MTSRIGLFVLGISWVCAVGAGFRMLLAYEHTPGEGARAPDQWPNASEIVRPPGRATLIMLAHPQCPCTRASIGELAILMARVHKSVSAYVLFVSPSDLAESWPRTDLWESAAAIPGVRTIADHDGREARLFHAATSGQTLVYDATGRLTFSGGITDARGHSGDNAGRTAIVSLLTTGTSDQRTTPVFGCSLLGAAGGPLAESAVAAADDGALVCR